MPFWFSRWFGTTDSRIPGPQDLTPGSGRLTTRTVTPEMAMQLSSVFASIRLVAETVSALPLRVYKLNSDGTRTLDMKHPVTQLFRYKPNQYQTRIEFFETYVSQLCGRGNGYSLKQRNPRGDVIGLLPLMTSQVETRLNENGSVVHIYHDGRKYIEYSYDDIWHTKLFGNGVIGLSPLENARNSLGVAYSAEDRVNKIANNGFKPAGVLSIDKVLKPEQREAIRQNFSDLAEGGEDNFKVLEAGMTYMQTSLSPKDVQFLESRQFQLGDIARFFGVPSVLINDTSASTVWGSGIEQIIEGFYKFTIRPYLERIELSIEANLFSPGERDRYEVEFDFDALLRSNTEKRVNTYKNGIQGGIYTPNECRAMEGLSPVKGGEVLYMQGQMRPIDMLDQPVPLATGFGTTKGDDNVQAN